MKIVLEARFPKYIYHQICDPVHSTLLAVQVLEELGSKQALNSLQKSTQNGFDYIWDHPRNYDLQVSMKNFSQSGSKIRLQEPKRTWQDSLKIQWLETMTQQTQGIADNMCVRGACY